MFKMTNHGNTAKSGGKKYLMAALLLSTFIGGSALAVPVTAEVKLPVESTSYLDRLVNMLVPGGMHQSPP